MTTKTYHVFSNNMDEWYNSLEEAEKCYSEFVKDFDCARLYEEIREDDEVVEENCLQAHGEWPQ